MFNMSVSFHFKAPSNFYPPSYATTLVGKKVSPKYPRKLLGTDLHAKKILLLGKNLVFSAIAKNDLRVIFQDSKLHTLKRAWSLKLFCLEPPLLKI